MQIIKQVFRDFRGGTLRRKQLKAFKLQNRLTKVKVLHSNQNYDILDSQMGPGLGDHKQPQVSSAGTVLFQFMFNKM